MRYESLRDIFETYLPFDFYNKNIIGSLMSDCGVFLREKNIDDESLKYFLIEFNLKNDQTYVEIKGSNLMSTLWLINVFPPNPKNLISESVFKSGDLTYIYNSNNKSLKIVENGSTRRSSTNTTKSRKSGKNKRSK